MKCLNPVPLPGASFTVPCGRCVNCCVTYSREWALRCIDEFKLSDGVGCMLTLTYAETDGDLHRDDLQKFFKRLRAHIAPQKVRYFYCGEYGGKGNRPHYHAILFGWRPHDLQEVSRSGDTVYYRSDTVAKLWSLGFVSVGNVTYESCVYCAKYLQKLDPREHKVKPFTGMSLKPGLGVMSLTADDIFRERKYYKGKSYPLPRYYVRKAEREGINVDVLKLHRQQFASSMSSEGIDYEEYADRVAEGDRRNRELFTVR